MTTYNNYSSLIEPVLKEQGLAIESPHRWLVTGAAGFIGSHLTEALLSLGQHVTALDNFRTGKAENLELAVRNAGPDAGTRLKFIRGSITEPDVCREAVTGAEFVLHEAACVSVPESIKAPSEYNDVNITGFLNILEAARVAGVRRVVYASSCAVYGDDPELPKTELSAVRCLSPYALTKAANELYANLWSRLYGLDCIGLRYFNVFGPRQDPNGAYAAVIAQWIHALQSGRLPVIYGDGTATRDFCPVCNIVLGNLLAALCEVPDNISGNVFNIACGKQTDLNELLEIIASIFSPGQTIQPVRKPSRPGDILHSAASIERACSIMGYRPVLSLREGLKLME